MADSLTEELSQNDLALACAHLRCIISSVIELRIMADSTTDAIKWPLRGYVEAVDVEALNALKDTILKEIDRRNKRNKDA